MHCYARGLLFTETHTHTLEALHAKCPPTTTRHTSVAVRKRKKKKMLCLCQSQYIIRVTVPCLVINIHHSVKCLDDENSFSRKSEASTS